MTFALTGLVVAVMATAPALAAPTAVSGSPASVAAAKATLAPVTAPAVKPATPAVPAATPTAAPTPTPAATAMPVAAVLPAAERRPYMGADGAMHYPMNGNGQPALTCMPLFVCDISLEANETLLNIATGDSARWLIASAQAGPGGATPHVLVKPTATNLHTNLVVTTSRRVYYIYLNSAPTTSYSRLSFFYPDDEAAAAAALASAERVREEARDAARAADQPLRPSGPVDTAFRQWGDVALLPAKVYADATHTFVEYAALPQDLPVLYAVTAGGDDQIVNYRVKDTLFIIDGTPRDVDLVLDAGTGRHGRGERRAHVRHL